MEPIIIPEPTGFAAKLKEGQEKLIKLLANAVDITQKPIQVATLGWIAQIMQHLKIVNLLGEILAALQESKATITSSRWIDAAGIYYVLVVDRGAIYTYLANGKDYEPIEPSRPVGDTAPLPGVLMPIDPIRSEPRYTRRSGQAELSIKAGATRITIQVLAGEVSCSNGDGTIPAGSAPISFVNADGLQELIFNGDADADYLVWCQYPVVEQTELVTNEPAPPILEESIIEPMPMTGDLLPAISDLAIAAA
jgi:hypothetical protein